MKMKPLGIAAALFASSSAASAATYGFTCITSGLPCTTIGTTDQLQVDITNPSGSDVRFFFTNAGGIDTSVTNIYFDSSLLSYSSPTIVNGAGTSFVANGNPANLPVGNKLAPPFSSDFNVSATAPPPVSGINAAEALAVTLSLLPGATFADFLASIGGETRIGLNLAAVGGSLVIEGGVRVNPVPGIVNIPVPGALPLMFAGLAGLGFMARRRRTS
jgi:hypothetical protein